MTTAPIAGTAPTAGTQVTPDPSSPVWYEASAFDPGLLPSLRAGNRRRAAWRNLP